MSYDIGPAPLFCPADRPERFAKALDRADAVILDLEDAVAPDAKATARDHVAAAAGEQDLDRVIVRVNPVDTGFFADDVAMVRAAGFRWVMLPKVESAADVAALRGEVPAAGIIALIETARGVVNAAEIAAAEGVEALFWGAEDLIASMGGTSSRLSDGTYRPLIQHARSAVALAAAAHGRAMLDAVFMDIANHGGLQAEAEDAVALGFAGTVCIHPAQVALVREVYTPAPEAVGRARRLVEAAQGNKGAFAFDGHMIDEVNLKQARLTLARAERAGSTSVPANPDSASPRPTQPTADRT